MMDSFEFYYAYFWRTFSGYYPVAVSSIYGLRK